MSRAEIRQDPIEAIHERVEVLSGQIDRAFVKMAETLPRLGGDLTVMATALEGCVASDSGRALNAQLHALAAWGDDLASALQVASGLRQQGAERSSMLISIAGELSAKLVSILPLSTTLRLIAINASAAAARGGSRAAGFAVLTRELDMVARTSVKTVPGIRSAADAVSRVAQDIVKSHSELETISAELGDKSARITDVIRSTTEILASLQGALGPALDSARAAGRPLGQIMVAAQRQDIVRQKFGHVIMALQEMDGIAPCQRQVRSTNMSTPEGQASMFEACWLRSRLCRLIGRLLVDALKDVEALCSDVDAGLGALDSAAAPLGELRKTIPDAAAIDPKLGGPVDLLQEIHASYSRVIALLAEQGEAAERLVPLAQSMRGALSTLASLNHLLGSINVQIKIEMAGPRFFATQASLSEDIDRLRNEYGQSIRTVADNLTAIARLSRWVGDTARASTDDRATERLTNAAGSMVGGLRQAASTFGDALDRSIRTGMSLAEKASEFRQAVDAMKADAAQGALIVTQCNELADQADEVLHNASLEVRKLLDSRLEGRLQDLIGKFSVLSHKSAAKGIASVQLGEADAPGTLTLF